MSAAVDERRRVRRGVTVVSAYPFAVLLIGVALNLLVFGVTPWVVALPSVESVRALAIAAVILVVNHTWIMTATELTRVRYRMYATPEEWAASGTRAEDALKDGVRELERHHNTHRNTTENVVYFALLAAIFVLTSPAPLAVQIWLVGFAIARLGYTYGYLAGKDGARGRFMTLSLLAQYGIASYLVIGALA